MLNDGVVQLVAVGRYHLVLTTTLAFLKQFLPVMNQWKWEQILCSTLNVLNSLKLLTVSHCTSQNFTSYSYFLQLNLSNPTDKILININDNRNLQKFSTRI